MVDREEHPVGKRALNVQRQHVTNNGIHEETGGQAH
jgi:hypothetical protein